MDPNISLFVVQHAFDIILTLIVVGKMLFFGSGDLRTKITALVFLSIVIYFGGLLRTQILRRGTSILGYAAIAIGIRLISLKMIFYVMDSEA
jgi:hypothetical protein